MGGDINVIRSQVYGVFLAYYLSSYKKREIAKLAQGNAVVHLYASHFKSLRVQLPHRDEQDKIASCLMSIDQKIEAVARQIKTMETFKKGLLQKMFV